VCVLCVCVCVCVYVISLLCDIVEGEEYPELRIHVGAALANLALHGVYVCVCVCVVCVCVSVCSYACVCMFIHGSHARTHSLTH